MIANKKPPEEFQTLINYKETFEPCPYTLIFSCRPEKDALEEIKLYAENYEDNFKNLDQAGSLFPKDQPIIKKSEIKKKSFEDQSLVEKIQHNEISIKINIIEKEQYESTLTKNKKDFKEYMNKEPEQKIYGTTKDGSVIFAFFSDNYLISKIGIMIGFNSNAEQMISHVSLDDNSQWTGYISK